MNFSLSNRILKPLSVTGTKSSTKAIATNRKATVSIEETLVHVTPWNSLKYYYERALRSILRRD
jgi:hypothetical protein